MTDNLVKNIRTAFDCETVVIKNIALRLAADRIEQLETELARTFKNFMEEGLRAEKLEAALDDALQFVSRADWHYLKDETRKALDAK